MDEMRVVREARVDERWVEREEREVAMESMVGWG